MTHPILRLANLLAGASLEPATIAVPQWDGRTFRYEYD